MDDFEEDDDIVRLEGEALAWVNRILSGAMTAEEADVLLEWRARSLAHRAAYAAAVRLRARFGAAVQVERRADALARPGPPRRSGRPGRG